MSWKRTFSSLIGIRLRAGYEENIYRHFHIAICTWMSIAYEVCNACKTIRHKLKIFLYWNVKFALKRNKRIFNILLIRYHCKSCTHLRSKETLIVWVTRELSCSISLKLRHPYLIRWGCWKFVHKQSPLLVKIFLSARKLWWESIVYTYQSLDTRLLTPMMDTLITNMYIFFISEKLNTSHAFWCKKYENFRKYRSVCFSNGS